MTLMALGVNHRIAPVEIREQFAFSLEKGAELIREVHQELAVNEVILLSTCNRTEFYLDCEDQAALADWLEQHPEFNHNVFNEHAYSLLQDEAVRHVMRVACGLDSMVVGEAEILGQLKSAFAVASHAGTVGKALGRLMQAAFSAAKLVRTQTDIGTNPVSVASCAVRLASHLFADLKNAQVLLIGAGDLMRTTALHLQEIGVKKLWVANRQLERAQELASTCGGEALTLDQIPGILPQADLVFSGTAAEQALLTKEQVAQALAIRHQRPMFFVDIAMPRDIEASVSELDDVFLFTLDDLKSIVENNKQQREKSVKIAEQLINNQVDQFMGWLHAQDNMLVLTEFRDKSTQIRDQVLAQAQLQLENGKEPDKVLEWLAHNLTNKLIHPPTRRLRQASFDNDHDLLALTRDLFELENKK